MPVKSVTKNLGLSPKRLRPLLSAVQGKNVQEVLDSLRFTPGPAAEQVAKAVKSAAANAENNLLMNPSRLKVTHAYADGAPVLKRMRAKARGRASKVIRRFSHLTIIVDQQEGA